jgi:excisionase family DNA binding protein
MEELFTVREVAEKLKISVSSVYRYVETGMFPCSKIGTNIRFSESDIIRFLSSRNRRSEMSEADKARALYDNDRWIP